jgi:hypothetical protein
MHVDKKIVIETWSELLPNFEAMGKVVIFAGMAAHITITFLSIPEIPKILVKANAITNPAPILRLELIAGSCNALHSILILDNCIPNVIRRIGTAALLNNVIGIRIFPENWILR